MGPPRRKLRETVEATLTPPDTLADGQILARVVKAEGKNLYTVESVVAQVLLVELAPQFRSAIWLKRGGFVLVDTTALADRDNKIAGEIVNVVRDEKVWRKQSYWPKQFEKKSTIALSDDEDDHVGRMPPSDDEES